MKIGVKIFSSKDRHFLDKVIDQFDFIETMAIENEDYSFLSDYGKKIVLHAQHQEFGTNPADASKQDKNTASINWAISLADELNAKKIIVHPGIIENKSCSKETALNFFKNINDNRIIIENIHDRDYIKTSNTPLCSTPELMAEFLKLTGKGFCFDVSHAIVSAILNKRKHDEFVIPFINLNPVHFHFSDVSFKSKRDHLALGEGNLDIDFYKKILPKNAEITLETNIDIKKLLNDSKIMKQ